MKGDNWYLQEKGHLGLELIVFKVELIVLVIIHSWIIINVYIDVTSSYQLAK